MKRELERVRANIRKSNVADNVPFPAPPSMSARQRQQIHSVKGANKQTTRRISNLADAVDKVAAHSHRTVQGFAAALSTIFSCIRTGLLAWSDPPDMPARSDGISHRVAAQLEIQRAISAAFAEWRPWRPTRPRGSENGSAATTHRAFATAPWRSARPRPGSTRQR